MGHKDLATTQIHAKVEQEHLRDVVTKLTAQISDHVSLKSVTQGDFEEIEPTVIKWVRRTVQELAGRQGFEPR